MQPIHRDLLTDILRTVLITLALATLTHAEPVPPSVLLYEQVKDRIPPMQYDGKAYGGINPCKLLERQNHPQPFFALPMDIDPEKQCDLSKVIVAYGGWCTAGVEDPSLIGPHFSQSLLPSVEIVRYDDGWTVIYLNHYLKTHTKRTKAGRDAAMQFFQVMPSQLDVRSAGMPLFPTEYLNHLPPKARP